MNVQNSTIEIVPAYAKKTSSNSKVILITGIALTALGIGTAILGGVPLLVAGISSAVIGATLIAATGVKWKHVLCYLFAVPMLNGFKVSDMKNHVFQERVCTKNGERLGRVFYDPDLGTDVPVLELHTTDPYKMGFVHGYLLVDKIEELTADVLWPMINLSGILVGDFNGNKLQKGLDQIIIPDKYLLELHGLHKGLKKYCEDRDKPLSISLNDLILAHKFADIYKSIGCQKILGFNAFSAVGCTTIAGKSLEGTVVARTLDWPAFIKGGQHMIVQRYRTPSGTLIESQTLPGIIHALTSKNSHGLVSIVNELGTKSIGGVPYGLVARDVIENAKNIDEGREILLKKLASDKEKPASTHHLTLIDCHDASNFQFYVENDQEFLERKLSEEPTGILIVTNHAIDGSGLSISGTEADGTTYARQKAVAEVHHHQSREITYSGMKSCIQATLTTPTTLTTLTTMGLSFCRYGRWCR